MKIAYIDELAYTRRHGGSAITTLQLSNSLRKLGFNTKVFSFAKGIKTSIPDAIKLLPNIRELMVFPYIGKRIIPEIERAYDIVHFSSTTTPAFYKPKKPSIITTRCLFSRQALLLSRYLGFPYNAVFGEPTYAIFKHMEGKSLENVDNVIVYKKDVGDFLVREMSISPSKISVIPLGIDVEKLKNIPKLRRQDFVLFVGRGTIAKGFDTLLHAADHINSKVVAVAPHTMPQYKAIARRRNNIDLIEGINHESLIKLYQRARLFVMPSLSETGPRVTLEAMACGLPIVCTPEGGGDFVKPGANGFIVPYRNPEELAKKVNLILDNPDVERRFGTESRRIAVTFSIQKRLKNIVKLYELLT